MPGIEIIIYAFLALALIVTVLFLVARSILKLIRSTSKMFFGAIAISGHSIADVPMLGNDFVPDNIVEESTLIDKDGDDLHPASLRRIEIHNRIYSSLWPDDKQKEKKPFDFNVLRLPAPVARKKVITEIDERENKATFLMDYFLSENHPRQVSQVVEHHSFSSDIPSFDDQPMLDEPMPIDNYISAEVLSDVNIKKASVKKKSKGKKLFDTFQDFRDATFKECEGRWLDIFATYIGNDESSVWSRKRNTTCPECGRTRKFYLIDPRSGATHCAHLACNFHCSDGFSTISAHTGDRYGRVVRKLGEDVGTVELKGKTKLNKKQFVKSPPKSTEMTHSQRNFLNHILMKSVKLTPSSIVFKYLLGRGIPASVIANTHQLLQMDKLKYIDDDGNKGLYPALVVPVSKDLDIIGFHRIYLDNEGNKLPFKEAKKPTGSYDDAYVGAVVKLGKPPRDGHYSIAEGVETALAVTALYDKSCWSTMFASGIQNFVPPADCKTLTIYADLDNSKAGEIVSKSLTQRLVLERPDIKVYTVFPNKDLWNKNENPKGIDFLNVLILKGLTTSEEVA